MFQDDKQLQVANPVAPNSPFHDLAEAIREGCKRLPRQHFGEMYEYDKDHNPIAACALGAADFSERGFATSDVNMDCPVCHTPDSARRLTLVAHLNDDHRWTRERIADWLDTL